MTIVPPTIAGSARRSEAPVAIMRIRAPKPAAPAIDKPLIERPAQAAAITTPRIRDPDKALAAPLRSGREHGEDLRWINLQTIYDLKRARAEMPDEVLDEIKTYTAHAA